MSIFPTGVITAATADEARSALAHNDVDLLILDYTLPGEMTGLDFYKSMREIGFDLHGLLAEGVAFLQKPFTPTVLAKKVRDILDSKNG